MHYATCARPRGFTLIEILVVLLIIGIMIAGAALTVGVAHGDRDLEQERDRLMAMSGYLREQAALQNREYGIRVFQGGYEFLVFEPRSRRWQRDARDDTQRARQLPAGIELTMAVEGRKIILPAHEARPDELTPQVLLYSTGELNLFELTLRRGADGPGVRLAPSGSTDEILVTNLATGAP
ncbi:MAG: type II secretion system minor pseudopilin GspH [Steroidobacteraceae bacterium]